MVAKNQHHHKSGCPVACALDLIGDHWTLLIIRDLMLLGRHEYKDILEGEEAISTGILTNRLKKLEANAIITSAPHKDSKKRKLYYLTEKGKGLVHTMLDIAKWSDKNLADRVLIPKERRPVLDLPIDIAAQQILSNLERWEEQNVPS